MKRENYKVAVNSLEEGREFRSALKAICESVASKSTFDYDKSNEWLLFNNQKDWICGTENTGENREIVTFKELIKLLVNAKKPLLISEDGVELFDGDNYHYAHFRDGKWVYLGLCDGLRSSYLEVEQPSIAKAFSSKQAALDWCEEQNKPKEIELEFGDVVLTITKNGVSFNKDVVSLNTKIIEKIAKAIKQLKTNHHANNINQL